MGVDLNYCENCKECLHNDWFRQCSICNNGSEHCDNCDDEKNLFGTGIYICDYCITNFDEKNDDFDINNFKKFKTTKQKLIKQIIEHKKNIFLMRL